MSARCQDGLTGGGKLPPTIQTVREHIAWSYANLARAHAALTDGATQYAMKHHMIRSRLYAGLVSGKVAMQSIYQDERLKMTSAQVCSYCGEAEKLSVDHLIPRVKDGPDDADNLVLACRRCNSSKQGNDLLVWSQATGRFPSVLVLRRYLKIVQRECADRELMEHSVGAASALDLPFRLDLLPYAFPPLAELRVAYGQ